MTVTPIRTREPLICPWCRVPTRNLPAHRRVCIPPPDPALADVVLLSGCHAASPETLPAAARLERMSDLDMARLMHALESGVAVVQGGAHRWTVPGRNALQNGHTAHWVGEALRTGLAGTATVSAGRTSLTIVVPGPVHARHARYLTRPACGESQALRHRLLGGEHLRLVTCDACLDAPLSAVSYSTDE